MKKLRVLFYAIAFIVATAGAYASSESPLVTGYILVDDECEPSINCNQMGAECKSGANIVFDGNPLSPPTTCGTALKHRP
jgi:hypothetical protein